MWEKSESGSKKEKKTKCDILNQTTEANKPDHLLGAFSCGTQHTSTHMKKHGFLVLSDKTKKEKERKIFKYIQIHEEICIPFPRNFSADRILFILIKIFHTVCSGVNID